MSWFGFGRKNPTKQGAEKVLPKLYRNKKVLEHIMDMLREEEELLLSFN